MSRKRSFNVWRKQQVTKQVTWCRRRKSFYYRRKKALPINWDMGKLWTKVAIFVLSYRWQTAHTAHFDLTYKTHRLAKLVYKESSSIYIRNRDPFLPLSRTKVTLLTRGALLNPLSQRMEKRTDLSYLIQVLTLASQLPAYYYSLSPRKPIHRAIK